MKPNFKYLFILAFITLFFVSCQDEETEINNPTPEEVVAPNSSLASLMRSTVAFDGSFDDILDNANCIGVNLPVTVTANNTTIVIETIDDLELIEDIFNAFNDDEDVLEFLFPITITLNDYTEVVVENEEELDAFVNNCVNEPDVIECVDFVYPIVFSIYNTDFQVIDTVEIQSDFELYVFLENLDGDEGAVLASLNFPVSLIYANGDTVEVTSNQELENAINSAEEDCNYVDCQAEDIAVNLQECQWVITSFNGDDNFIQYDLHFNANGELQITHGDTTEFIGGEWQVTTEENVVLTLSNLTAFSGDLGGDWLVQNCDSNQLVLTQEFENQTVEVIMEQDCETVETPFNCFENTTITACDYDNDGFATFEMETQILGNVVCNVDFVASFHVSQTNAEANINAIVAPNAYTNTSNPQTIYLRIEANDGNFQIFEIELIVEDCSSNCTEADIDAYLQGCNWNVVNFNGDDHLMAYEIDFSSSTEAIITGNGITTTMYWSSYQAAEGVVVEFSNVAAPNIQAITGSWLVVACEEGRLEFESLDSANTMVMECHYYTPEELLTTLSACQWEVYSFQVENVDQTSDYNDVLFSFFENDFALAEVGANTINYGNIEAESVNGGTELSAFLSINGTISSLGGYYSVLSITEDEVTLMTAQPKRLILRKTCTNDNQDGDTTQIKDWLYDGNWEVTYSTMENAENSQDYDGVVFNFQSNATLLGDNGSWIAELDYDVLRDNEGNLRFVINYLGQFPYWQMDDDWYITSVNSTQIELHAVNDVNNTDFVLIFEKM
ncbi:MAG: hypothetical protein GYB39_04430 [Algicola sp.]|nr:hypothetical protein [Algicola sp.]